MTDFCMFVILVLNGLTDIWAMFLFYTTKGFPVFFRGYKMGTLVSNELKESNFPRVQKKTMLQWMTSP